jgi:AraC-like DNA-binding protein
MDRNYAGPLDVRAVAAVAHISAAHFSRCFRSIFGETPHRYLQRRRIERSMFLLRETDRTVTGVCFAVGFTSLGTFSRTFREIVGETPSAYRGARPDRGAALRPARRPATSEQRWAASTVEQFGEAAPVTGP